MNFKEIIGNAEVKEYLNKSIMQNNILHSYLFIGTEGIGKALIAKEFSKQILCLKNENLCECKSCISFEGNNHPDFLFIDTDETSIKVESVREVIDKIYEKPILSSKKVIIINNCDKMTVEAQNCFLKTLEEPPEYIVIILITSNENLILNTIRSRCMAVKFHNIKDDELLNYCKEVLEYTNISNNLIKSFGGSIGKAIKLKNFKEKYDEIENLVLNLEQVSIIELLKNKKIFDKENIFDILDYLIVCLYSKINDNSNYIKCIDHVNDCIKRLHAYSNFDMTIDNLLFNMWEELNESSNRC